MSDLKELELRVQREEKGLEKAKRDLAKAKKSKKKSSSRKSKKEKQREIEASLKEVDLRAAMGELKIEEPNPAIYAKKLIEKASLTELKKVQKAAKDFLEREKKKEEEKEAKKQVAKQHLESLGIDLNSLKDLLQ